MTKPGVCCCGRLVCAALPLSSTVFNIKSYCSQRCAEQHALSQQLITCGVCCEEKLIADYLHKVGGGDWNVPVPRGCLPHLAPELLSMEGGTCLDCLRAHITVQFETRGAINITCVHPHRIATGNITEAQLDLAISQDWVPYAYHFLPPHQHDSYHQQLLDSYFHSNGVEIWTCPADCGYAGGILQVDDTPGFPHVECPGCHVRFCAGCRVVWHAKQTCQQYRGQHPELRDEHEVQHLRDMAELGARRCPRCQIIIVKNEGCDHMFCEGCYFDFDWQAAELVTAPVETYVPAPVVSDATIAFRGWEQLRQAQEAYIDRHQIDDTPFDIATNSTAHNDDGLFYYTLNGGFWTPELCELDRIARRDAGRRLIRSPEHDRVEQWAFREVDVAYKGGLELHEALHELVASVDDVQAEVPPHVRAIWEGGFAPPVDEHPAIQALDQLLDNLRLEELRRIEEMRALPSSPVDEESAPPADGAPFLPPWGPPEDAMDALVDQMLFGGMNLGPGEVRTVHFGFGLGLPLMNMFPGGGEQGNGTQRESGLE